MLFQHLADVILSHWWFILPIAFGVYGIQQRYNRGLNKYPGPFLASLTDLWRTFHLLWTRKLHDANVELHEKHGDVVRLGPNLLSFGDPRAIKDIYGLNKGYIKV